MTDNFKVFSSSKLNTSGTTWSFQCFKLDIELIQTAPYPGIDKNEELWVLHAQNKIQEGKLMIIGAIFFEGEAQRLQLEFFSN